MTAITPMKTTTLVIERPEHFDKLSARFQLVRYTLENFWDSEAEDRFKRLHIYLRAQLDHPFISFYHDMLDGDERPVVYVLYPRDMEPQAVILPFLQDEPLPMSNIGFKDLPHHCLVKLLQARYFLAEGELRFVGLGECYGYAKEDSDGTHVCLEIELKGNRYNEIEFKVKGHATPFKLVGEHERSPFKKAYYRPVPIANQLTFAQLTYGEVESFTGNVYEIRPASYRRTTLDYHSQSDLDESRGKLLCDFTSNFIEYLSEFRILAGHKVREFEKFSPMYDKEDLPIKTLGPVALLDIRFNLEMIPTSYYQRALQDRFGLPFEIINAPDPDSQQPLLILQDFNAADFGTAGIFVDRKDPRRAIYSPDFVKIPKQTISVNPNVARKCDYDVDRYLDYSAVSLVAGKKTNGVDYGMRFEVALNQLYLKDLIVKEPKISGKLPGLTASGVEPGQPRLQDYAYLSKDSTFSNVLLYFEEDEPRFVDVRKPEGKAKRDEITRQFGLDWDEIEERLIDKYPPQRHRDTTSYDLILGQGLVVDLENIEESVLYEYDEIERRQHDLTQQYPIDKLKLADHYDHIKPAGLLGLNEVLGLDTPQTPKEKDSVKFYSQLQHYDAFLDNLARNRVDISFEELTDKPLMTEIGKIFGIKGADQGKARRTQLQGYYKKLGRFLSERGADVQYFQGIWSDLEYCYMVGSPDPLQYGQPRAHLIRKFDVQRGQEKFPMSLFLEAVAVKFVRHQQYTVLPYPFYLIELYVDNRSSDA